LLDRPTAGEISFESTPYSSVSDESLFRRQHFGFIFQSFHLIPTVTTTDNVMLPTLGCAGTRQSHLARARELLGRLGMGHRMHQFPGELSGGERQRVAIARALINHADVILADEPTGSLDSANAQQVLQLLADIRRERGLTVILVTHDKSVSEQADRTVHMCDGRVVSTSGYGA
jgi:ABC-type lipoprotein export system ATPase subunit